MQKPKSQRLSLVFVALLAFVMMIFAGFGMTYAYFQGSKISEGEFKIGSVGAKWYNGGTALSNTNIYQLAGTTELERGDSAGASLVKADGTAGGDLRLVANSDSTGQYVRVKPKATVGKNLLAPDETWKTTANGLTVEYLSSDDCFVLNGTSTKTSMYAYKWINLAGTKGHTYSISTNYVSGTVSRPTDKTYYAVVYFGASDTENTTNNWESCNLENYDTKNENRVCNYNYITRFWFYVTGGVSFNNYKVKVQFEEGAKATDYEKHIEQEDVLSYLTFRYVSSSTTYVFGSNTFWKSGGDGWYYYINANTKNVLNASSYSLVCNNIVLSGTYPTRLLGKTIRITFTYEALQSVNSPVESVWGTSAATALGIS